MIDLYAIFSPPSAEHPEGEMVSEAFREASKAWFNVAGYEASTLIANGYTCRKVRVYASGFSDESGAIEAARRNGCKPEELHVCHACDGTGYVA